MCLEWQFIQLLALRIRRQPGRDDRNWIYTPTQRPMSVLSHDTRCISVTRACWNSKRLISTRGSDGRAHTCYIAIYGYPASKQLFDEHQLPRYLSDCRNLAAVIRWLRIVSLSVRLRHFDSIHRVLLTLRVVGISREQCLKVRSPLFHLFARSSQR